MHDAYDMHHATACQPAQKILAKNSAALNNVCTMHIHKTVEEIRLANLRLLIEECPEYRKGKKTARAGSLAAVALYCDTTASYLSQILIRFKHNGKTRQVGTDLARKLEKGAGKPEGWMDTSHEEINSQENELRLHFAAMDDDAKEALLNIARKMGETVPKQKRGKK